MLKIILCNVFVSSLHGKTILVGIIEEDDMDLDKTLEMEKAVNAANKITGIKQ